MKFNIQEPNSALRRRAEFCVTLQPYITEFICVNLAALKFISLEFSALFQLEFSAYYMC